MKQTEPNQDLAESLLRSGWTLRLRVTGSSMRPLLRSGTVLRIAPSHERPIVGDIAFFRSAGGRLVAHRVLACEENRIWTKGDSSGQADGPVEVSDVIGRVLGIDEPFFLPLTGGVARRVGLVLNRYYPWLVQFKQSLLRFLPRALRFAGESR